MSNKNVKPIKDIFEENPLLVESKTDETTARQKTLDYYEKCLKNKTILQVHITHADNYGNLISHIDYGVKGIIKNLKPESDTEKRHKTKERSKYINRNFAVVVTKVGRDEGHVYFSPEEAKEMIHEEYLKKIKKGLVVSARVKFVSSDEQRVYVDIGGCGVKGYIPIKQWTKGYIYNPQETIIKNSTVRVKILRIINKKISSGITTVYECSRSELMTDPWEGIEEEFPRNSIITTTVLKVTPEYFFGSVPGREISLLGYYPRNNERYNKGLDPIIVKKYHKYKMLVTEVSQENKRLVCKTISEVLESEDKSEELEG